MQNNTIQMSPNTKIFGATLATSLLNRVGTNFLEVGNTRVLKNVGDFHQKVMPKSYISKQHQGHSTKIYSVLKDIWRTEGLKGYFRGLNTGIGLSLLRSGVFFPIYEYRKFMHFISFWGTFTELFKF